MSGARALWLGVTALALLGPGRATAQATVFAGGVAALPVGDFADVAEPGYRVHSGGMVDLGTTGFLVGATGFFGSNPHTIEGERSDLYGVTVLGGYTVAEAQSIRFTGWVGLGGMIHTRKSDVFPGLDASKRGLTLSVGGSVSRPVGRIGVFVSGLYTRGLGDLGTSTYPSEFVTLGGGVAIPLSVD